MYHLIIMNGERTLLAASEHRDSLIRLFDILNGEYTDALGTIYPLEIIRAY